METTRPRRSPQFWNFNNFYNFTLTTLHQNPTPCPVLESRLSYSYLLNCLKNIEFIAISSNLAHFNKIKKTNGTGYFLNMAEFLASMVKKLEIKSSGNKCIIVFKLNDKAWFSKTKLTSQPENSNTSFERNFFIYEKIVYFTIQWGSQIWTSIQIFI